jgi:hypothetical protein
MRTNLRLQSLTSQQLTCSVQEPEVRHGKLPPVQVSRGIHRAGTFGRDEQTPYTRSNAFDTGQPNPAELPGTANSDEFYAATLLTLGVKGTHSERTNRAPNRRSANDDNG